ncbi:hypothetical protein GY45DRAFT_1324807 [Cubamyces sp. BRFM 1775]|nr:hypothetical protein GY45DRAFT_1324807 [Cubamyces sp. BRFM 1775]
MLDVAAIPTDIWSLILPLACTDGGFTGKSLAMTCSFFHMQAYHFRFYSLAFDTLAKMESFLAFVRRQSGGFQPRITHLYISYSDHPNNRSQWSWRTVVRMTDARFRLAFDTLLRLAAPNLQTLCVAQDWTPVTIQCSLPQLEELIWMGSTFLPDADVESGPDPGSPTIDKFNSDENSIFPALKRIHIILSSLSRPLSPALLRPLDVAANTLTHVRISNVDSATMSMGLIGALTPDVYVGIFGQPPPTTSLFPSLVLPTLRYLTVQYILRGEHEAEARGSQPPTTTVQVRDFEAHDGKIGRMYLLSDGEHIHTHWCNQLKEEWSDQIEGGYGYWVGRKEEEGARWKHSESTAVDT